MVFYMMGSYVIGSFCAGLLCDGSLCNGSFSDGTLYRGSKHHELVKHCIMHFNRCQPLASSVRSTSRESKGNANSAKRDKSKN